MWYINTRTLRGGSACSNGSLTSIEDVSYFAQFFPCITFNDSICLTVKMSVNDFTLNDIEIILQHVMSDKMTFIYFYLLIFIAALIFWGCCPKHQQAEVRGALCQPAHYWHRQILLTEAAMIYDLPGLCCPGTPPEQSHRH